MGILILILNRGLLPLKKESFLEMIPVVIPILDQMTFYQNSHLMIPILDQMTFYQNSHLMMTVLIQMLQHKFKIKDHAQRHQRNNNLNQHQPRKNSLMTMTPMMISSKMMMMIGG